MKLESLLKGQTIRIDTHHWDGKTELKWGTELHLHKIMNRKNTQAEVLIYIADENRELEFRKNFHKEDEIIKNEIRRAFSDKNIRTKFVKDFYKTLKEYQDKIHIKDEKIKRDNMLNAAKRFVELIGLKSNTFECIDKDYNIYYNKESNTYVQVDKYITIGDNREYVINFDKNVNKEH
ncbi:MAG: hypothetical protein J6Z01_07980 [Bacteroidales bacterium]|nr:hypothetical protein [Bacteroidales bacterium]